MATFHPLNVGDRVVCDTGALDGADLFTGLIVVSADPELGAYDVALEDERNVVYTNVDRADLRPIT